MDDIQQSKFKVGDVVRLRSGGPAMAVEEVNGQGMPEYRFVVTCDKCAMPNGPPCAECTAMLKELSQILNSCVWTTLD